MRISTVSILCHSVVDCYGQLCVNATGVLVKWLFLLKRQGKSTTENPCVGGSIPPLGTTNSQETRLAINIARRVSFPRLTVRDSVGLPSHTLLAAVIRWLVLPANSGWSSCSICPNKMAGERMEAAEAGLEQDLRKKGLVSESDPAEGLDE